MGWTSFHTDEKNNKNVILNHVLYGKTETEEQIYHSVRQIGTNVYILGQNKADGKYWIDMVYCNRYPERYDNFFYKGVSAVPNAAYGVIPQSWLEKLEQTEEVQKFIQGNKKYLETKKARDKNFPDYKSIQNGEKFSCTFKASCKAASVEIKSGETVPGVWYNDALLIYGCRLSKQRIKTLLDKMVPEAK